MPTTAPSLTVSTPSGSTVVHLCNQILAGAVDAGASYVHIEPTLTGLIVRYRVGRFLNTIMTVPHRRAGAIRNRYKVMSRVNVGEKRRPQGGAFKLRVNGRPVDVQLSTVPTIQGEKIVMRVIDLRGQPVRLEPFDYETEGLSLLPHAPDRIQVVELGEGLRAPAARRRRAA